MNKKSVFLVGTRYFGVLGPCKLLIRRLTSMGYDVHVFANSDAHYLDLFENNCSLHKIYMKRSYYSFWYDLLDVIKISFFALKYKPLHLHSFNPKPQLLAFFVVSLFPSIRFYVGVTGLGNTFIKAKYIRKIVELFMQLSVKRAKFVFFQNEYDVSLFVLKLHLSATKALIFPSPGVDLEKYKFSSLSNHIENKSLKFNILFVGRLIWQKGVDDFFALYKLIERSNLLDFSEFTLVGAIDNEHPDRLLSADIKFLDSSSINWVKWTNKIEDYYSRCDVLVFMSDREGGPRAILEASAVGRPTIGCNAPGVDQLIINNETGYLVEKGDTESICNYIQLYRENPNLKCQHGSNARSKIAEKLSLERATDAQLMMYL